MYAHFYAYIIIPIYSRFPKTQASRYVRTSWAGIWRDNGDAEFRHYPLGSSLANEILLRACQAREPVKNGYLFNFFPVEAGKSRSLLPRLTTRTCVSRLPARPPKEECVSLRSMAFTAFCARQYHP